MGRSADSKLTQADDLDKRAAKLKQADPESSRELKELARRQRKAAIKQLKHRPKKRQSSSRTVL